MRLLVLNLSAELANVGESGILQGVIRASLGTPKSAT